LLALRTSDIKELLMQVSHLEETNAQFASTLEEVTGCLEKAEARLRALGEAPEGGATGRNTASRAEGGSKGRTTMCQSLKVSYSVTSPVEPRLMSSAAYVAFDVL
jgi:hypothetical protein